MEKSRHHRTIAALGICMLWLGGCIANKTNSTAAKNHCFNDLPETVKAAAVFKATPERELSRLRVNGTCLNDDAGNPIVLRGVSIADPEHVERNRRGENAASVFQSAKDFGSSVIRLPLHKGDAPGWGISSDAKSYLETYVDPLVALAAKSGIYVIIDFHLIDNYLPQRELAHQFWAIAAEKYGTQPHVIFELFNEPIYPDSWSEWKNSFADPLIQEIRTIAPDTLIIVGSPHWSVHLKDAALDPINDDNVIYTAHIYPTIPTQEIDENYKRLVNKIPLFVTEWGFDQDNELKGSRSSFGDPLVGWMNENGLSWTAWVYDSEWGQNIFDEHWQLRKGDGHMGELVHQQLNQE